ncbi:MAG: hypothetical protein H7X97_14590, partial [Opitutaceae bacterium]|nr:hypothetical protein [Verrucomicrobiales bacterium]
PGIQVVVVNVPHVGITRYVKDTWPNDAVKTARVTAVLRDLNNQLAALAAARNVGYADIFTPTLPLLNNQTLFCLHGVTFQNSASSMGAHTHAWLNGDLSKKFHPNTSPQALIANQIIGAFNKRYQTGIAPLSATEILGNILGKTPAEIDMTFAAWMTGHARTGLPTSDDSDGDGIPAGVEFAVGLNPALHDSGVIASRVVGSEFELAYPLRLNSSANFSLAPASSTNLAGPFTPFPVLPVPGPDGLSRARIPLAPSPGFIRLQSTVNP